MMPNPLHISISEEIKRNLPALRLGCLGFTVTVAPSPVLLRAQIQHDMDEVCGTLITEDIAQLPAIQAARNAYRTLGKDPSRYRPAAEALTRRVVAGKGLYQISNVVDTLNLISLRYGFSIGGYDRDTISGRVVMGRGNAEEPYEAIGRGHLNIENLPVLRDRAGAFGCPTSDSIRTMVTGRTGNFLMVVFDFGGSEMLEACIETSVNFFAEFVGADCAVRSTIS